MNGQELKDKLYNDIQANVTGLLIAGMDLDKAIERARDESAASLQIFESATKKYNQLFFFVQGRNDYYGVDEYSNILGDQFSNNTRMVDSFKTKKKAKAVCHHLNRLAQHINQLNLQAIKGGLK